MEMSEASNDAQLEQIQTELTPEIIAALETLRNAGFAVCAFTPTGAKATVFATSKIGSANTGGT